jgi:subtilisin family serine protease
MSIRASLFTLLLFVPLLSFGQMNAPENWFNLSFESDSVYGAGTEKAYELLQDRESKTVVVAVIDSGVDWEHEDLKEVMWVNEDEIPNNGKDDDNNGYIDDIHGWNFIGNPNGENVEADNLEVTRLYRMYHKKFKDVNPIHLKGKEKQKYLEYLRTKKVMNRGHEKAKQNLDRILQQKESLNMAFDKLEEIIGDERLTADNLNEIDAGDDTGLATAINIANRALQGAKEEEMIMVDDVREMVVEGVQRGIDYYSNQVNAYYNPDFNPRHIVNDDYSDPYEIGYGNNDYEGPDAFHGTHVAGIIAAIRNNDLGINGVADNVRIMTIRAVPDGDERDKDVANAIRYAVDNGASVVNMSFGKGFVWNKEVVDEAVDYAEEKDVLLVHAAGNSSLDNDTNDNYPNDQYDRSCWFCDKDADNWIEVGALNWKTGESLPAPFSNYGDEQVDLFAPGMVIYSTVPDDKYENAQGTSMASPVVAGVAALVRSYFPTLTAEQTKDILMETVTPIDGMVKVPGQNSKAAFENLCVTGGVVNAYEAVKKAMDTKGKKKMKKKEADESTASLN